MRSIERGTVLLGKYRVDSVVGHGGMGLVLKAWHMGLDEEVAIKMLRDDIAIADETIARFVREAQAAVRLKGEHIARISDVGTFASGKPYLVMEFLEGQDLGQLLTERGRLQPSLAIDLVIQACEALAEAHSLGIVHRDIKPTNLFLTSRPDGSLLLKVLDFGISKSPAGAELSLTQTWSLLGSPAYMSPEQMRSARDVDARTDVWSLGAVLYQALEGRLPFEADSFSEVCVMVAVDPPAAMSATPPELVPVIARCLAKNPDDRYASVAELARNLARLAREPDKARVLVDRMDRMLGRGVVRRTPASLSLPIPHAVPPPRSGFWPQGSSPTMRDALETDSRRPPSGELPQLPSPPSGDSRPNLPFARPAHVTPSSHLALSPGWPLPAEPVAPAPLPRRRRSPLTATQVISRTPRGWLIPVIAAVVALAAAIVVAAVTRPPASAPPAPDDTPSVVRMNPVGAPSVVPITPGPTAPQGSASGPSPSARDR